MKKFLKMTIVMMLVLALLTGCGASSMAADKYAPMENMAVESPAAPMPEYALDVEFATYQYRRYTITTAIV